MPFASLLSKDQVDAGSEAIFQNGNKLTESMIIDLISIFRGYLGSLYDDYPIETTLRAEIDVEFGPKKCAKLAACLLKFQDEQFTPASGFAPTVANRTGFNYSMDGEVYEVFKYAWGLFWNIPQELEIRFQNNGALRFRGSEGVFLRR